MSKKFVFVALGLIAIAIITIVVVSFRKPADKEKVSELTPEMEYYDNQIDVSSEYFVASEDLRDAFSKFCLEEYNYTVTGDILFVRTSNGNFATRICIASDTLLNCFYDVETGKFTGWISTIDEEALPDEGGTA